MPAPDQTRPMQETQAAEGRPDDKPARYQTVALLQAELVVRMAAAANNMDLPEDVTFTEAFASMPDDARHYFCRAADAAVSYIAACQGSHLIRRDLHAVGNSKLN